MKLSKTLHSMMALLLALCISSNAAAQEFTIAAEDTHKAKPGWWPNGTNIKSYNVRDFAALNGELWCIVVNGAQNTNTIKVINGTTFESVKDVSLTNVSETSQWSQRLSSIRRMGDQIVACNGAIDDLNVYRWKSKTATPDVILTVKGFTQCQGMGVWGTMTNGKLYFLKGTSTSQASTTLYIYPVENNKVITTEPEVKIIQLPADVVTSGRQYSICPMDDGSVWVTTNHIWGVHVKEDGSVIEKFTGDNIGAENGTGQKHFTFLGRKLAVTTNFTDKWVSPMMALIDYSDGVGSKQKNLLPKWDAPLSTTAQDKICTTGADYEISNDGNRLDVWGLDPIGGIYHAWYEKQVLPDKVPSLTITPSWNGTAQTAKLEWASTVNATSYVLYKEVNGASVKIWEGTDTSYSMDLPMGEDAVMYCIKGKNAKGESEKGTFATAYNAEFGKVKLTGEIVTDENNNPTAKLTWTAPANGTLVNYTLVKKITKTGGSTTTTTEEKVTTTTETSYDYAGYKASETVVENGVTYNISSSLYVRANMEQTITTKDGKLNTVTSNTIAPVPASVPYFTDVTTYEGRRTVALSWEIASTTNLNYYELYRDGIRILSSYNGGSYIDTDLPDGTYNYYLIAYWTINGKKSTTRSADVSATIRYAADVSTYILDEVYNYPIMDKEEWTSAGTPEDAVVATGKFANARMKVGAWGAPGDVYRQAQFYNGKWYIAQLTARTEPSKKGNYIPNSWDTNDIGSYTSLDVYKNDWKGGIYSISADAASIKNIGELMKREHDTWGLENQSVAVDLSGNYWRRSIKSGDMTYRNLFLWPINWLAGSVGKNVQPTYNGKTFTELSSSIPTGADAQYYRTHYISAGGKVADGTAYILCAMNESADVYKISLNASGDITKTEKFTAPYQSMLDKNGKAADPTGSTENYAVPFPGRNAFFQTVRGIGTWFYDMDTNKYSLLYSNNADIIQSGGVAFTYNNEMFILHPTSIRSNNPGYFRIDMVQRAEGETAATVIPTKDNLIPTVANKLDEATQFTAGNSNASWYGAEYDATDDCIYIYQYVPGVRFAKYRLYVREQYPDVPPTLDITTAYNNDQTEITHFDSKITWQRPGTAHDYGMSENADIVVDHYEVTLKDNQGNAVKTWKDVADVKDASHTFTLGYNKTDAGEYNLDSEKYTAEIVPIYRRKNGTIIRGASNFAVDNNDYPAAIGEVNAWIYKGTQSGYRVDLDFDRADAAASIEPVSYFLVEVSTDGGNTYSTLGNFNLIKNGEDYHYYPVNVTNGQISGQYKFGTDYPGDKPSEKGYALREKANYATDHKCVLYYYTNTDPSDYKYRVTAVYAATNRAISKTASNIATNNVGGTSGIDDVNAYSLGAYPIPATTEITVTSPEAIRDIRIFSVAGAEVVRAAGEDAYTQKVDVSNLAAGVYMLVVNEQAPIRIVKK